jgi:hypothetical protein
VTSPAERHEAVLDVVNNLRHTQGERYAAQVLTLQNLLSMSSGYPVEIVTAMLHNAALAFGLEMPKDAEVLNRLRLDVNALSMQTRRK